MVPVAPGKHRRPEAEPPQAPGRMPLSTAEYLPAPAGIARPDPDWPADTNGVSWPQFSSPAPMLHPDHPSAPVPRVRATPGPQGPAGPRPVPADYPRRPEPGYDFGPGYRDYEPTPGYPSARGDQAGGGQRRLYAVPDDARPGGPAGVQPDHGQASPLGDQQVTGPFGPAGQVLTAAEQQAAAITHEAWGQAAAVQHAAEQEAAAIRQRAASQAAAIRDAAEREAAELKAALLAMSGELGRAAAYVTHNLAPPGTEPAVLPAEPPAALPGGSATKPARPASRLGRAATGPGTKPARPATRPARPDARPASKPAGRQARVARRFAVAFAAVSLVGVVSGTAELALHGLPFFIFRANGAGASETGPTEPANPELPTAPAAHHQATAGRS